MMRACHGRQPEFAAHARRPAADGPPVRGRHRRGAVGVVPAAAADPAAHARAGHRGAVGALPPIRGTVSPGARARGRDPRAARDARRGRQPRPAARPEVGRRHRVHAGRRRAAHRRQGDRDACEPLLRAAVDLSSRRGALRAPQRVRGSPDHRRPAGKRHARVRAAVARGQRHHARQRDLHRRRFQRIVATARRGQGGHRDAGRRRRDGHDPARAALPPV